MINISSPSPSPSTGCSQGGILDSKSWRQPSSRATVRASKHKQNGLVAEGEEAANKRPIGRPKKDCYSLTIWTSGSQLLCNRGIGTHEGEAVWQGEDEWEEGVGVEEEEDHAATHAEQVRAAQSSSR